MSPPPVRSEYSLWLLPLDDTFVYVIFYHYNTLLKYLWTTHLLYNRHVYVDTVVVTFGSTLVSRPIFRSLNHLLNIKSLPYQLSRRKMWQCDGLQVLDTLFRLPHTLLSHVLTERFFILICKPLLCFRI